jgi:hypothetical protein
MNTMNRGDEGYELAETPDGGVPAAVVPLRRTPPPPEDIRAATAREEREWNAKGVASDAVHLLAAWTHQKPEEAHDGGILARLAVDAVLACRHAAEEALEEKEREKKP